MHIPRDVPAAPVAASFPARAPVPGAAWADWLGMVMDRLRENAELRDLSPRERRDAGLGDLEAVSLARKPLWRA